MYSNLLRALFSELNACMSTWTGFGPFLEAIRVFTMGMEKERETLLMVVEAPNRMVIKYL